MHRNQFSRRKKQMILLVVDMQKAIVDDELYAYDT